MHASFTSFSNNCPISKLKPTLIKWKKKKKEIHLLQAISLYVLLRCYSTKSYRVLPETPCSSDPHGWLYMSNNLSAYRQGTRKSWRHPHRCTSLDNWVSCSGNYLEWQTLQVANQCSSIADRLHQEPTKRNLKRKHYSMSDLVGLFYAKISLTNMCFNYMQKCNFTISLNR